MTHHITAETAGWRPAPGLATRPIFAIGDVHGRLDLLTALHARIRAIVAAEKLQNALVVHLGDYIDRGPHPLDCLMLALAGANGSDAGERDAAGSGAGGSGVADPVPSKIESIALAGNHEQFMYRFLAAAEAALEPAAHQQPHLTSFGNILAEIDAEDVADVARAWFSYNCGTAVARELGYDVPELALDDLRTFHARLTQFLGPEMLARFRAMPNHFRLGDYFFVHGGLHPALGLADQLAPHWGSYRSDARDSDPLWVRGPFLTHPGSFEFHSSDDYADYTGPFVVVHGHTISETPEVLHNRIGVDTGAFMTGRLTAVELRADKLRFITATGPTVEWGVY
jgi:serine/threonine protein phosphatase 1